MPKKTTRKPKKDKKPKKTTKKNKGGRPHKYDPIRHPMIAQSLAYSGKVNEEIAFAMGVSEWAFYDWKKKYPEFSQAVKGGKDPLIRQIENELIKNCITRDVVKIKETQIKDKEGKPISEKKIDTTSEVQLGSVEAQKFALKNMAPDKWRDRQDIFLDEGAEFDGTSEEELEKQAERYRRILGRTTTDKNRKKTGNNKG